METGKSPKKYRSVRNDNLVNKDFERAWIKDVSFIRAFLLYRHLRISRFLGGKIISGFAKRRFTCEHLAGDRFDLFAHCRKFRCNLLAVSKRKNIRVIMMLNFFQELVQTSLAFFSILIFTRIIGKQQVSQLTFYDYINGVTFGSIAATIATDPRGNLWHHMMDLLIFAILTLLIGYVVLKNRPLRKMLDGEPTVVIHNGKILENNMRLMRYNLDDLAMQLRQKDIFNISDVEFAILESDGQLSVQPKSQKRMVTPADLNLPTSYEGLSSELIMDGKIIHQNLLQNNLTEEWLLQELANRGIRDVHEVMFCSLESDGSLYFDMRKDNLQSPRDISDFPPKEPK